MNKIRGRKSLEEQNYELIQAHIIDPENSQLPEGLQQQFARVLQVARLLDDYPNESHIINVMLAKYPVSRTQVRKDVALAKELFKTQHTFDWDFWFAWQIKDQMELIRQAKLKGDLKNWNNAKKTLMVMIGEKPAAVDDPRRMEHNTFYIQVNNNGNPINVSLDAIRKLPEEDLKQLVDSMYEPISEINAEELMNS